MVILATLILTLIVPQSPVPVGQPIPIALELCNVSDHPVWVTGVLDGSEAGIRYPYFLPQVTLDGKTVVGPPTAEDPLVAPLRLADFHLLQPGEALNPEGVLGEPGYTPLFTFLNFRPDRPGDYEVSVIFSTESASPEDWLGRFGQDVDRDAVLKRVADIPQLTLTATATVEVR